MRGHKFAILLASLPLFISQTVSYAGEAPFNSYSECAATNPNSASACGVVVGLVQGRLAWL